MGDKNASDEFGAVFQGAIDTWQASVTKRMAALMGAARTRTSSAHVGSHSSQTMFFEKSLLEKGTGDECEHTVARRMGEVCQKTGDPAQLSGGRSKIESSREASRSTRLRLPTASWALCILPCSRWVLKLIRGCGPQIVPGESSMECGGTRGCHTRSNGHSFAALFAEPPSRASLHFSFHDRDHLRLQRCLEKKLRALMLRHGLMGRTRPHKDPQLSPSVEKVAAGASCIRAL